MFCRLSTTVWATVCKTETRLSPNKTHTNTRTHMQHRCTHTGRHRVSSIKSKRRVAGPRRQKTTVVFYGKCIESDVVDYSRSVYIKSTITVKQSFVVEQWGQLGPFARFGLKAWTKHYSVCWIFGILLFTLYNIPYINIFIFWKRLNLSKHKGHNIIHSTSVCSVHFYVYDTHITLWMWH